MWNQLPTSLSSSDPAILTLKRDRNDILCSSTDTAVDSRLHCPAPSWLLQSLAHSMSLCNREASIVRLSVCKLCANRYFYHRSGWIATKLAHDGPHMGLHPGSRSRSKVTWYGHFSDYTKIASSTTNMIGSRIRDQTCTRWSPYGPASRMCSRSRSRSKVTWYGHLWFHENRFFSQANGWIATKLAHDGPHMGLHPGCAQGQGQGQRSCDTDTFVISRKSLLLAGKWLDRDQTCTRLSLTGLSQVCGCDSASSI